MQGSAVQQHRSAVWLPSEVQHPSAAKLKNRFAETRTGYDDDDDDDDDVPVTSRDYVALLEALLGEAADDERVLLVDIGGSLVLL